MDRAFRPNVATTVQRKGRSVPSRARSVQSAEGSDQRHGNRVPGAGTTRSRCSPDGAAGVGKVGQKRTSRCQPHTCRLERAPRKTEPLGCWGVPQSARPGCASPVTSGVHRLAPAVPLRRHGPSISDDGESHGNPEHAGWAARGRTSRPRKTGRTPSEYGAVTQFRSLPTDHPTTSRRPAQLADSRSAEAPVRLVSGVPGRVSAGFQENCL